MSEDQDKCSECGAPIEQENYMTEPDGYTEYWGAMVPMPDVVTGYKCPVCEHEGKF